MGNRVLGAMESHVSETPGIVDVRTDFACPGNPRVWHPRIPAARAAARAGGAGGGADGGADGGAGWGEGPPDPPSPSNHSTKKVPGAPTAPPKGASSIGI